MNIEEEREYELLHAHTTSTVQTLVECFWKIGGSATVNYDGTIDASFAGISYNIRVHSYMVRIWHEFSRTYATSYFEQYVDDSVTLVNLEPMTIMIHSQSEDRELTYLHTRSDFVLLPEITSPEQLLMFHLMMINSAEAKLDALLEERK